MQLLRRKFPESYKVWQHWVTKLTMHEPIWKIQMLERSIMEQTAGRKHKRNKNLNYKNNYVLYMNIKH
jgi:hypothetical protein